MSTSRALSGASQPFKGILLLVLATFLFSSHDALSKYLSGFYPVMMVVWARYLGHTLLMAGIFLPQSGLRVLRTRRPLLQASRALCLLGTSLLFTNGLMFIPLAEATAVNFLAPLMVTALSGPLLGWFSSWEAPAFMAGWSGYHTLFAVSAVGRMLAWVLLRPVKEERAWRTRDLLRSARTAWKGVGLPWR